MRTAVTMAVVFCLLTLMATVASSAVVQVGSTVDLIAGKNGPDVGDVTVNWDNVSGELQVVMDLMSSLGFTETHLYVGLTPPTTSTPGKFPYSHEGLGGAPSDTYDFGEIGAYSDQTIYVAAHGALTDGRTVWGKGSLIKGKGSWAMYFSVVIPAITPGPDTTAPYVISTIPVDLATGVGINTNITATFNEAMLASTIDGTTFTLYQGLTPIAGAVTYAASTATFNPDFDLAPNATFTATITTGATDLAGNPLVSNYVWTFTTGAGAVVLPVNLGSAGNFAVLAGTTVTNTASKTVVNGDLGVWTGTAVTHFPPGIVNGTIHAGDAVAQQAQADLTVAYNDLAGRVAPAPATLSGNIGGMTLYPGLYKSTSSLAISSGDLTLDAQGDGNAVFIFQIASTLTTTVGRQIILAGGANAANIYWQVGSSATLGTYSVFKGSILANVSITATTGATVTGRLLARTGAVTLDNNTVTLP